MHSGSCWSSARAIFFANPSMKAGSRPDSIQKIDNHLLWGETYTHTNTIYTIIYTRDTWYIGSQEAKRILIGLKNWECNGFGSRCRLGSKSIDVLGIGCSTWTIPRETCYYTKNLIIVNLIQLWSVGDSWCSLGTPPKHLYPYWNQAWCRLRPTHIIQVRHM